MSLFARQISTKSPIRFLSRSLTSDAREILFSKDATGIVRISLNRPNRFNALSKLLIYQLRESLEKIRIDKTARVLILKSSTPGKWCSGADLTERLEMSNQEVADFLKNMRLAFTALESLKIPTIAAIDGPALGGGLELSLCCDLRVAGHHVTKIGFPETQLGIIPGAGGTQRAVKILGVSKAKDLIFTCKMLGATEALQEGLIDYISNVEEDTNSRANRLAEKILESAPLALQAAKHSINKALELNLQEGLDLERANYELLLGTKDRVIALEAFRDKRKPVFKGY